MRSLIPCLLLIAVLIVGLLYLQLGGSAGPAAAPPMCLRPKYPLLEHFLAPNSQQADDEGTIMEDEGEVHGYFSPSTSGGWIPIVAFNAIRNAVPVDLDGARRVVGYMFSEGTEEEKRRIRDAATAYHLEQSLDKANKEALAWHSLYDSEHEKWIQSDKDVVLFATYIKCLAALAVIVGCAFVVFGVLMTQKHRQELSHHKRSATVAAAHAAATAAHAATTNHTVLALEKQKGGLQVEHEYDRLQLWYDEGSQASVILAQGDEILARRSLEAAATASLSRILLCDHVEGYEGVQLRREEEFAARELLALDQTLALEAQAEDAFTAAFDAECLRVKIQYQEKLAPGRTAAEMQRQILGLQTQLAVLTAALVEQRDARSLTASTSLTNSFATRDSLGGDLGAEMQCSTGSDVSETAGATDDQLSHRSNESVPTTGGDTAHGAPTLMAD